MTLTVIGDGPARRRMRRFIRRHGLAGTVTLAGPRTREQIAAALAQADAFLAPSRLESFGIAAAEAHAAGVAVLGWAGTGLAEFVRTPADGALVGSDEEMVQRLVEWATSGAPRPSYGDWHDHPHDWSRVLPATAAAYGYERQDVVAD